jgi:hemerythrin-like domain-containing protein
MHRRFGMLAITRQDFRKKHMNSVKQAALIPAAESAINRIKSEHHALACILGAMQVLVARYREPAAAPDFELLDLMLRYVENVPDRVHHPKEDRVLFPPVALRARNGKALVRELERDHARGAPMLAELRRAFRVFREGGVNALNQLSTAVDEFTEFYSYHMRKEEEQLLPLAAATLSQREWQRVESAFSDNSDPLFDAKLTHEYRRLYEQITELTPRYLKSLLESAATKSNARDRTPTQRKKTGNRLLKLCCYATGRIKIPR